MELFEHAFPVEDGAIHGPNGKYFFPAVGVTKPKDLTKRKTLMLIVSFIVVVAITITVAAYLGDTGIRELELYDQIYGLVGQPVTSVPTELIPLAQVSEGVYKVERTVKYVGSEFEVYLYFDENEGLLDSFEYTAAYNSDDKTAAVNISRFMDQFFRNDALELNEETVNVGRKALTSQFREGGSLAVEESWGITPPNAIPGDSVAEYLEHLENAEYYDGRVGEYLTKEARFYRDISAQYAPQEGVVRLSLSFTVESDRNKK